MRNIESIKSDILDLSRLIKGETSSDEEYSQAIYDLSLCCEEFLSHESSSIYVSFINSEENMTIDAITQDEFRESQHLRDVVMENEWVWQYAHTKNHAIKLHIQKHNQWVIDDMSGEAKEFY